MALVGVLIMLLFFGLGIATLVMAILIAVKMIKAEQTGLGIATIVLCFVCGIGYFMALIIGWKNAREWNIAGLMKAYTACIIGYFVALILYVVMFVFVASQGLNTEFQNEMNNMQIEGLEEQMENMQFDQIEFETTPSQE